MKNNLSFGSIDELCHVEYGTRVVKKRDAGTIFPVYGGGGATFFMDEFNREDQFIISRFGMSEKCTRFVEGKFFLNDSGLTLKPKDENILNQRYLDYQCLSLNDLFFSLGKGSAQKNLHVDSFKKVILAYHPLPVQKQIVEKIDAAFADIDKAISATKKNIENAEALYSAKSDSFFSENREQTKLSEVVSITSVLIDPKHEPYKEMLHVGAGNIESETGNLNDVITASEERLTSGKFPFDNSMVLYSKIRPNLKKVVKPEFSGICSADIYPLSVKKELITREFLFHLLLSRNFTDYAIAGSNRAGMPKVNRTHLFNYEFHLPDIPKQKEITGSLDKFACCCRRLIQINTYKIDNLNSLKSSMLSQAFSGELTKDAA